MAEVKYRYLMENKNIFFKEKYNETARMSDINIIKELIF